MPATIHPGVSVLGLRLTKASWPISPGGGLNKDNAAQILEILDGCSKRGDRFYLFHLHQIRKGGRVAADAANRMSEVMIRKVSCE